MKENAIQKYNQLEWPLSRESWSKFPSTPRLAALEVTQANITQYLNQKSSPYIKFNSSASAARENFLMLARLIGPRLFRLEPSDFTSPLFWNCWEGSIHLLYPCGGWDLNAPALPGAWSKILYESSLTSRYLITSVDMNVGYTQITPEKSKY